MCPFGIVATLFTSFSPDAFRTVGESYADSGTKIKREGGDVIVGEPRSKCFLSISEQHMMLQLDLLVIFTF